ncbi:MAG: hypothetical protein JNJ85_13390, partial [Candidatus Kapabacteria bacterium]|nr:hypothetical protein [Candidatus Kapabacteria bacterium]
MANTSNIIRLISITSSTNVFVQGNTFGSSNSALGILAVANPSSSSITADITGIFQSSGSNFFVQNNTCNNFNYVVPSGLTIATAIQTRGIFAQSGFLTITGNSVSNLINSALNNNTGNSSPTSVAVIGISATSTSSSTTPGTLHTVSQNIVSNLSATSTVAGSQNVLGFNIGSINSISPYNVSRNIVHSLSASTNATTTTPNVVGINIAGGAHQIPNYHTITNNFVRLGLDASGTSIANNLYFHGIWKSSTSTSCSTIVAHNSVYIGGTMSSTVTGTGNNYAFRRMTTTTTMIDTVMNNVFVNARSTQTGSTGTGNYFAVALSQTATAGRMVGLNMNYNLLYSPTGIIGQSGSTNYTDIIAWRGAGNVDLNSISANPNFINPTGTAATFNLLVQNPTPIERAGKILRSVVTDFDNNVRANLSPSDIGAQAGTFTFQADVTPPEINYTPLSSPITVTTPRTITVTVTDDISGVPTSGTGLPRLYWKIRYNGTVNAVPGTYIGGGQYTFTYGNGVTLGDTVYYYVAAQDNAVTPNVALSTWNGVTSVTANPPAPNAEPTRTFQSFYAIAGTCFSGNYNVGTGGTYTTLSTALSALTNGVICGDVTLTIISNITENSSPSITYPNYGGATSPYKITIRPDQNGTTPFTILSTSGSYLTL